MRAKMGFFLAGICFLAVLVFDIVPVPAQDKNIDPGMAAMGKGIYSGYCTNCHGASGKGDGLISGHLSPRPKNLTELRKNGVSFDKMAMFIDGRNTPRDCDMPVWGETFLRNDQDGNEASMMQKIRALAQFVWSIQE